MNRLTPEHFLAAADAAIESGNYDFFVQPDEALQKSATLAEAQREAAALAEARSA